MISRNSAWIVAGGQDHLITANGDTILRAGLFPRRTSAPTASIAPGISTATRSPSEILGYQAQDIGNAQALSSLEEEVVELEITRVTEEVRITDRLLPLEERILDAFPAAGPGRGDRERLHDRRRRRCQPDRHHGYRRAQPGAAMASKSATCWRSTRPANWSSTRWRANVQLPDVRAGPGHGVRGGREGQLCACPQSQPSAESDGQGQEPLT
jgi:hypothetical protein